MGSIHSLFNSRNRRGNEIDIEGNSLVLNEEGATDSNRVYTPRAPRRQLSTNLQNNNNNNNNNNNESFSAATITSVLAMPSTEHEKTRSWGSIAFGIISLMITLGAIAMPEWSCMVAQSDATVIGRYGLFQAVVLRVDALNNTYPINENFFEYYAIGELSLIFCIILVIIFNMCITVIGLFISFGVCPHYLSFLFKFSVFNVFAVVNYIIVMGLWLWISERIPTTHKTQDKNNIRNIYPEVSIRFGYGFYIFAISVFLLLLAAVFNILHCNLIKANFSCLRSVNSNENARIYSNPLIYPVNRMHSLLVQIPNEPPAYREQGTPQTTPLSPPALNPTVFNSSF